MATTWQRLAEHARRHHATIGWHEARHLGIPASTLSSWCQQGRLVAAAPGVYVVAGAAPSWHQRAMVATTSGRGWLSHRAAAALWGLDGFPMRRIEVLTPYARRRKRDRSQWVVHESRRLHGVDLDEVDGIPCTSVVRTILDLPAVAHPHRVEQALDHACRTRPGTLEAVVARFVELAGRGRPGTKLLRRLLGERLGVGRFSQSTFETMALRLVRSIGLPDPVLQHRVADGDGFVAYLDLAWPAITWAVECDSLAHHTGKQPHEWDRRRRRRLKQLGWDLVEVTYDDLRFRPELTGLELRRLYRDRCRLVSVVLQRAIAR